MRKNKRFFGLTAATCQALLLVSACRDGPTGPDDSLIDAEIVEIAKSFGSLLFSGVTDPSEDVFGTANDFPCNGGTVTTTLSEPEIDEEEELFIVFAYEVNPKGCAVSVEGGARIQIHGDPAIGGEARMRLEEPPGPFSLRITAEGGFRYETNDGRSGTCQVDVTHNIEGTLDFTQGSSVTETLRGTACGKDIEYRESS